ncbi:anaerobic glycerol-3-phosphate dehydrogenase subunit B [Vibrio sp. MACH09]|uniref:glycerol-3-phosphate dehydrogenase subunit GlpB n=1 Tax=Vibrio sp. MACH09 TaxID=3025122 RepID=UPI00278FB802|nr:glycerol-3-phosphate dehydrogenase subunit GlpB [Vibrio sp. MACH09]GLO60510.1 anaerobic glycerol-3-phosphate dehydrogenase subunit B [Vibrio sp. MACH09]
MKYDVIVIGGGMAGYTSAIRCLEKGYKTAIINNGRSALHFSSGSVELLSVTPSGTPVRAPFQAISRFANEYPEHPFAKVGGECVSNAINWFTEMMSGAGLALKQREDNENHQRITTLGTLKSTFLSQPFVEQIGYNATQHQFERVVILSIEGFRDFQSNVVADNLTANPLFKNTPMVSATISLENKQNQTQHTNNYRSTDFAKLLSNDQDFFNFANQIGSCATAKDLVIIPAILGTNDGLETLQRLKIYTGLNFHEVPTMPPSLMGIRLEETLEKQFIKLGGVLLKGDCVTEGEFSQTEHGLKLTSIWTKNLRDYALTADAFVLASGSFFSNGLKARHNEIIEPVFGLDICATGSRNDWHDEQFFSPNSHAFISFGVETNAHFQPRLKGKTVDNLYCCGSILAHYNPVSEGSGGGVAISTAYFVSDKITQNDNNKVMLEIGQC